MDVNLEEVAKSLLSKMSSEATSAEQGNLSKEAMIPTGSMSMGRTSERSSNQPTAPAVPGGAGAVKPSGVAPTTVVNNGGLAAVPK